MYIIAKTIKGREFMYNPKTARRVSARSAKTILEVVNRYSFLLDTERGEIWHIYEVDKYDIAYDYAQFQAFTIRKGIVSARAY